MRTNIHINKKKQFLCTFCLSLFFTHHRLVGRSIQFCLKCNVIPFITAYRCYCSRSHRCIVVIIIEMLLLMPKLFASSTFPSLFSLLSHSLSLLCPLPTERLKRISFKIHRKYSNYEFDRLFVVDLLRIPLIRIHQLQLVL